MTTHSARLTPVSPQTVWRLDGGVLRQDSGKARAAYPLSDLTRLTLIPAGPRRAHPSAILVFGLKRLTIPSASFGSRGIEPHPESFSALIRALCRQGAAAAPKARFILAGTADRRSPFVWGIVLTGLGALAMLSMSFDPASVGIGLSLASRLVFVGLLLAAVLPWIGPGGRDFDPRAVPAGVLP
jgi:hypothetical protein